MNEHVAVFVLNRNMREMTERLIETVRKVSTSQIWIYALDAASDDDQVVQNADILIRFSENRRWAWSFATGMKLALDPAEVMSDLPLRSITYPGRVPHPDRLTHFWLICNDTQLDPKVDTLATLLSNLPSDACQIHPYQKTHPFGSPQGRHGYDANPEKDIKKVHNVAFVEFVCPLITREFYDACLANFQTSPVNPEFSYGWGVDYEMAYFGHQLKLKSYICDAVGITHHPGTTHIAHEKTKVEDNNQMRVLARNSMLDVLEKRYGRNWGERFANSARAAGVDPQAFLDWSQHDRALALKGARV